MLFQRSDENGDGQLDYDEFKALIFRNRERKELQKLQEKDVHLFRSATLLEDQYDGAVENPSQPEEEIEEDIHSEFSFQFESEISEEIEEEEPEEMFYDISILD